MRFNWNTGTLKLLKHYPEVQLLVSASIDQIDHQEDMDILAKILHDIRLKSTPIYYFSKTITDVVQANWGSLQKLLHELPFRRSCHLIDDNHCLINIIDSPLSYFFFIKDGVLMDGLGVEIFKDGKFRSAQMSDVITAKEGLDTLAVKAMMCETFLEFAETETIILDPKSTGKFKVNTGTEKLKSNKGLPVQIIDSRYFRNIIRTEGFSVRGHFRMQPYGPGLSKKKLIWISEFEKSGYVSKAFKDKNN